MYIHLSGVYAGMVLALFGIHYFLAVLVNVVCLKLTISIPRRTLYYII